MIRFEVPGDPFPMPRPRFRKVGVPYYPREVVEAKNAVRVYAQQAMRTADKRPTARPVRVDLWFELRIPESWALWKRNAADIAQLRPTGKPDVDNLVKLVMDAMNGIVWMDDAQVCVVLSRKLYSLNPKTVVTVSLLGGVPSAVESLEGFKACGGATYAE